MVVSGMSGNEMYCLKTLGLNPGEVVVGNSVYSLGALGSLTSGIMQVVGGEVTSVTDYVQQGRQSAIARLEQEAKDRHALGITDVNSDIVQHTTMGNVEFLSIGSAVHSDTPEKDTFSFSSSIDGTELFCNMDAGYVPKSFVFGNVAYSLGIARGLFGSLKSLVRGEITEYSDILNKTRHMALQRIVAEAKQAGANAVLNIETKIQPYAPGITEMILIGTASYNPALPEEFMQNPISSDLTSTELWSMTKMGIVPLKFVLGTSVFSLGLVGGIFSAIKSFIRGEISELTHLVYDAREKALALLYTEANEIGADDVLGTKIYFYELGNGLVELMAIGTAVRKGFDVKTKSNELIPQAIIVDQSTFTDSSSMNIGNSRVGVSV